MSIREVRLKEEIEWLKEENVDVVLSDATFLGWWARLSLLSFQIYVLILLSTYSAAAAGASIPSILVTK